MLKPGRSQVSQDAWSLYSESSGVQKGFLDPLGMTELLFQGLVHLTVYFTGILVL